MCGLFLFFFILIILSVKQFDFNLAVKAKHVAVSELISVLKYSQEFCAVNAT